MKKCNKRDYNYNPKFKKGDVIMRNNKWYNDFAEGTKTHYVNPYHRAFSNGSILTISYIQVTEFSNFILKSYVFNEQLHAYDSKIVDIEYDLHENTIRALKLQNIKKKLKYIT